jgi:anaphase-promoting complex subunit 4
LEWAPERIEINGRKGRRIICVLAKDKTNYRIYDIDSVDEQDEDMLEDKPEGHAGVMN